MKRFSDLFGLVLNYRWNLAANVLFNVLNAFLSLFTFLAIVPFLRILFRHGEAATATASNAAASTGGASNGAASAVFAQVSTALDGFIAEEGALSALLSLCIGIVVLAFLKNLVTYLAYYSLATIRTGVARDLRAQVFNCMLILPLGYFTEARKGDLISRMTNDLMEVEFSVIGTLEVLFKAPIMIVLSLATLLLISWELTLFALVFMPLSGLLISRIAASLKNAAGRGKVRLGELISRIEETLTGMPIVKSFSAEERFRGRFASENEGYFQLMRKLYKREYLSSPVSEFVSLGIIAVLLFVGGKLVLAGEGLEGELFIGYLVVFSQIIPPAKSLSDAIFKIQKGAASLERLEEVMQAKSTVVEPSEPTTARFDEQIHFRDVAMTYPGGEQAALNGIDLKINKGETVALVGASGSGKTTAARLLARLYDPSEGVITWDGVDARCFATSDLRSMMGTVTQDSLLFNATVAENIALFDPSPDPARIEEVARIANAHDFVEQLPQGYHTLVGDGGGRLSGGQRQRLSIARALYHDPPVLVLDEATSALDAEGEKLVQAAIERVMEHRTVLVIDHRLSTIRRADRIVVLEQGRIIEVGDHQQLVSKKGAYATMVAMQAFDS
ncbi:MAG: ABC transporter ATP-binding protein [Flavobacteriales bacterium]|nr:ABC transporter ATP-binding protein [Flavobacteriales bacterium]